MSENLDSTSPPVTPEESSSFWVSYAGVEQGPLTKAQVNALISSNGLAGFFWRKGMPKWAPLSEIDGAKSNSAATEEQSPESRRSDVSEQAANVEPSKGKMLAAVETQVVDSTLRTAQVKTVGYGAHVQSASDKITGKLGLDRIEGFSLSHFFSETFRKHDADEVDRLLSVGTSATTPALDERMGDMPTPWVFFRMLTGTVIAYLIFLLAWKEFHNVNVLPGLIMIGSFAIPLSVLILFFELNTPKNISIVKIMQLVVIGGALSILVSLVLFEISPFLGVLGASAAGPVEEVGKLLALLLALKAAGLNRYKYRLNALLLGAAVGTGFAAFESAGYALRYGLTEGSDSMLGVIEMRGALSPFSHIVWTAIAASAYWINRLYRDLCGNQSFPRLSAGCDPGVGW